MFRIAMPIPLFSLTRIVMNRLVLKVFTFHLLYTIDCSVWLSFIDSELPVDKNTPLDIQDKKTTPEATEGEFFSFPESL